MSAKKYMSEKNTKIGGKNKINKAALRFFLTFLKAISIPIKIAKIAAAEKTNKITLPIAASIALEPGDSLIT